MRGFPPPSCCRLCLDLQSQLACRGEDQGPGAEAMRLRGFLCQVLQHGQREGGSLASAGLGDAEQIAAGEQMRNGGCLDWRWFNVSRLVEGTQQRLGKAEGREGIQ